MTAYSKNMTATKRILARAVKEQHRDNDSVFLIAGQEGIGKSTFLLHCISIVDELKKRETPIESVCRTLKELIVQLRYCQDEEQKALDEGSELASDNQYMGVVKAVKKSFTVMRAKRLIVYICFTNPLKIHTYFREDRVKGAFFITKRGVVFFYTRSQLQNLMEKIKKYKSGIRSIAILTKLEHPLFIDTFPDYQGKLLKDYKRRKKENINEILDELYNDFGVEEKLYSLAQAAKFLKVDDAILRGYLREDENDKDPNHVLPFEWNLTKTKRRIREKDLIDFKLWFELKKKEQADKEAKEKAEQAGNLPHVVINAKEKKTEKEDPKGE